MKENLISLINRNRLSDKSLFFGQAIATKELLFSLSSGMLVPALSTQEAIRDVHGQPRFQTSMQGLELTKVPGTVLGKTWGNFV